MSVVILGMEIPKSCESCGIPCELWMRHKVGQRHPNCPIRPLPEMHGRLIDADEATRGSLKRTGKRLLAIDTAPTIVEAEGD